MSDQPVNPRLALLASLLIPGGGHVLQRKTQRGLMFLFFTVVLGWVSVRLMPETASFFSRHVGGIFLYGLSVIDSYKIARINWETWNYAERQKALDGNKQD
ncbi:DUF6677 family protein [Aestuariivirga sp.]|jgi:hypothetical protein|uniref:DUF6677 family protein n=1 Tax=Aestuariivirga sp. TaxID=2650926 RepID=UPI0037846191